MFSSTSFASSTSAQVISAAARRAKCSLTSETAASSPPRCRIKPSLMSLQRRASRERRSIFPRNARGSLVTRARGLG